MGGEAAPSVFNIQGALLGFQFPVTVCVWGLTRALQNDTPENTERQVFGQRGTSNVLPTWVFQRESSNVSLPARGSSNVGPRAAVSECRGVERCRGGVGAVSGRCRLTLVSGCRGGVGPGVGECRGFLIVHGVGLVGVSGSVECRSVEQCRACRACRVSGCRAVRGSVGPRC